MITIFTIPKPFTDPHINVIQRNAIKSWILLGYEIILMGDDEGVAETAQEFKIKHIPNIAKNEFGTPLLNSAFHLAQKHAKNDTLLYINADIIFLNDFSNITKLLSNNFLVVGRRWDLDIEKEISFTDPKWKDSIKNKGKLHSSSGIDYFLFHRESFKKIPPFAVGRIGWDNWMIYEARKKKMKVIDVTETIRAIHQNHGYPNSNKGVRRKTSEEATKNISFIKKKRNVFTIDDANWKMTKQGLKRNYFHWLPFTRRYVREITNTY